MPKATTYFAAFTAVDTMFTSGAIDAWQVFSLTLYKRTTICLCANRTVACDIADALNARPE